MFILSGKNGPIVSFKDKSTAQRWAEKFDWTVTEVPDGENREPILLKTGYLNLLEPSKDAIYQESIVSFTPENHVTFPNAENVKKDDIFYRSNLANTFFCVEDGQNPNDLALEFWTKLDKAELAIERISNEAFRIVSVKRSNPALRV